MKKLLTVFLSVLMMLGTLTTVTGAAEIEKADDRFSDAEVAAIIEEAFPEHNMATAKTKNSVSAWYTIYTSSYDKINSKGSVSDPNGSTGQTVVERWQENSSGPATVRYSVPFEQPLLGGSITVTPKVYIGNNQKTHDIF